MLKNLYPINDKLIRFIRCKIQAFYLGNKFFGRINSENYKLMTVDFSKFSNSLSRIVFPILL